MKKIEENIEKMNQLKHIIEYYLKHIKIVKGNTDIYEKNKKNNYKNHFKEYLQYLDKITNIISIQQDLEKYKNIFQHLFLNLIIH